MKLVRDEIFGPVCTLIKFKTEEEAIEQANDTEYGLACHIFTENITRAIRVSNVIEAGTAWVCSSQIPCLFEAWLTLSRSIVRKFLIQQSLSVDTSNLAWAAKRANTP